MTKISGDLIFQIEIPNFITQIQVSKQRKAVYYEFNNPKTMVPKSKLKYLGTKFFWKLYKTPSGKIKNYLHDKNGDLVLKNPRVAGKPKFVQIKGNDFYSGFSTPHQRIMVVNAIKDNFREYFKQVSPITDYPVYLQFKIHNEMILKKSKGKNLSQDLDNQAFAYVKSSQDLMKEVKIILDDNLAYIRKVSYEFIDSKDKKLEIFAYKY